ncbi:uncharacterized protein [Setaria viridis]|uniref:MADS-box domain-containing protein n=1 Tax=Setaria viridis TaxID=4556 RepID=A0A4U6U3L8_SETVI|nr:uncharacterized protein LOC117861846 [Setaria viridis]TKW10170.1 hypothetical protein SEVIR_6G144800v2 [Setaria viridis]
MGRRRASTGLIPNRRARGDTLRQRRKGLRKMARELSVLCGVDVALVVAAAAADGGGGAGPADVWESREGVLARYRALAPEARARHVHRAYLEGELGKEEAKLARVRQGGPGGLQGWEDRALDGVATAGEARGLLEAIDAAILAADGRRRALGVPADDDGGAGVVIEGIAPQLLNSAAGVVDGDCYVPHHGPGGFDDADGQFIWGIDGGFQPCGAADMQPGGYGFRQCGTTIGAATEGCHLQMAPGMYGNSNSHLADACPYQLPRHAQPNLAPTWSAADEPRHAMVPVEYYYPSDTGLSYNYTVDTQAAANASQGNGGWSFATGASGNFLNSPAPPALSLAMATGGGGGGGNFVDAPPAPAALAHTTGRAGDNFAITCAAPAQPLAMSYGGDLRDAGWYAEQWQWQAAPEPQRDGGGGRQPVERLSSLYSM